MRKVINSLKTAVIKAKYPFDLENSFEKEPRLEPIERTAGFFSYHTDWLSMFCIDEKGEIWSNEKSLLFLKSKTHEVRFAGLIPWGYFPKETDSKNYFTSFAFEIVRGIAHTQRRELSLGDDFRELLSNIDYIMSEVERAGMFGKLENYAESKGVGLDEVIRLSKNVKIAQ